MGASGCHHQVLVEGELAPHFFHFRFASFWVPSLGLDRRGAKLPFFCCFCDAIANFQQKGCLLLFFSFVFLLLLRHHCQDSAKRELALSFFIFFVAYGAPWPSFSRREA